jgi:hypothetical protein
MSNGDDMTTAAASPLTVFTPADADKSKPMNVRFGVTIVKVDKDKRLVTGRATAEVIDAHNQVVDYATIKEALKSWKGNLREMHQAKAVGRAVEVECVDATKEVYVTSYVSKGAEDTWQKVLDGTLAEYSIGARFLLKTEKVEDKTVEKLYALRMNELSLVDVGACPGSSFNIVKMDGDQPTMAQDLEAGELEDDKKPEDIIDPAVPPAADPVAQVVKAAATPALMRALITRAADAGPVSVDLTKLDGLDLTKDVAIEKRANGYDVRSALSCIAYLQDLVSSKIYQVKDGEASPEDQSQLTLLEDAAELLLAFAIAEFMGQFPDAVDVTDATSADAVVKMIGDVRRQSALDLRATHGDLITKLRAVPALQIAAESVLTTAADGSDLQKLQDTLTETTKALEAAKSTIAAQAGSIEAIEKRMKSLEDSPAPGGPVVRGGGVPVSKELGNQTTGTAGEADPAEVIKLLTEAAASTKDPAAKEAIAQKILAYQMSSGAGRMLMVQGQPKQ